MSQETDAIIALIQSFQIPHRVTSVYRPGDPGRHGGDLAVDFAGPIPYILDPIRARNTMLALATELVPYEHLFFEIICSHLPYYVKRGVRKDIDLLPRSVFNGHFNHLHTAVNHGVLVTPILIPPEVIIVPDDPNLPNIVGPVEFHPVVNSTTGTCTGYYIFSPVTGELHSWGAGAVFHGRSEVISASG